jgi:benzoate/toluate 1,2-dioxygenase alpha subunit
VNSTLRAADVASFVDDRVEQGMFRVDRSIYLDARLYAAEVEAFFEKGWVFLCHESQIRNSGDYYSTHFGRQPVFVARTRDGQLKGFINACAHRASILTPRRSGNAKAYICRFHGWVFDADGKCLKVTGEEHGGYPYDGPCREQFRLTPLAHVESYRGFVFGSLVVDVPSLKEHLGGAHAFIDMFADQSPVGLEVVPGSSTYVCHHNWKLQVENVPDGYHVPIVHRNFASTTLRREDKGGYEGLMKTEKGRMQGGVKTGCYDLGRGHMVIWADRASPEAAPLSASAPEVEARVGAKRAEWMLRRGRNLIVFPNLVLNDLASTHLRTMRPLGPELTEITIWCIAPIGEPRAARIARLRKFEDFFLVTGMATSDDVVSLDLAHAGSRGRAARWNEFTRGLDTLIEGPDALALELGISPQSSNRSWDHETPYIGFYRYWRDQLIHNITSAAAI